MENMTGTNEQRKQKLLAFHNINLGVSNNRRTFCYLLPTNSGNTMENEDQVMQFFGRAYNKVLELYNDDDKEEECIAAAQNLLEDPDLPRYHRIKTLVLLGSAFNEWDETETCRLEAERL